MVPWTFLLSAFFVAMFPSTGHGRTRGIVGQDAPAVWAQSWKNLPKGVQTFDVHSQRGKVLVLFFFQSWCPGCHSRGFPALEAAVKRFGRAPDIAFATVQTVFEGASVNTAEKAWSTVAEYGLSIPVGHDPGPRGKRSLTMDRYRSGGTPWFVIIDRAGRVRFDGFHLGASKLISWIETLRFESGPMSRSP